MRFGFNDVTEHWRGQIAAAKMVGADTARVPIGWNVEPGTFATLASQLAAAKVTPIICLWGIEPPPTADYATQAARWAQAYPAALIELWNEPNNPTFGGLTVEQAADYTEAAASAIRLSFPGRTVIGPAPSPAPDGDGYLDDLYSLVAAPVSVGCHIYPHRKDPRAELTATFRVAHKHGPVYVTEIGYMRSVYGAKRDQYSARGYTRLRDLGAKAAVFHRLLSDANPSEWERNAAMGVLDHPILRRALREARASDP